MASLKEGVKVFLWCMLHYPEYKYKSWQTRAIKARLNILSSIETVEHIASHRSSVARYGDGELQMVSHYLSQGSRETFNVDTFQHYDPLLAKRLYEILRSTDAEGLLLCLPYQLKHPEISDLYGELFWEREWLLRKDVLSATSLDRVLGDTNFTRFYMGRRDIKDYPDYITRLRNLWQGRDVLIVEGEYSRLGVGNDLFNTAQRLRRVLCPSTNAFARYDEIYNEVHRLSGKDTLVILALGMTATVLAYDLHKAGLQALDLGHIDVEYEWYRMKAKGKVAIPHKYVNEVSSGRISQDNEVDRLYQEQIVSQVL